MSFSFKKYSLFAFILLSLGLFLTIFLVNNRTNFFSRASSGDFPQNIHISNITDDSATISYQTDGKFVGNILFGADSNNLEFISIDDRDQLNQISNPYNFHHITLRGLEPNTKYFFSINSGVNNYLNNDSLFELQTGYLISKNPPTQIPAVGSVELKNGTSPAEGIAYLSSGKSQLISALIKNGNYIIPLNNLRNSNLDDYFIINSGDEISIETFANQQGNLSIINSTELSPVENIILQENYNPQASIYSPKVNHPKTNPSPTPTPEDKGWNFLNIFNL